MSCFLPPACLFCIHYHTDGAGVSCDAFDEIPDAIFHGGLTHSRRFPGDKGLLFQLSHEDIDGFREINLLREKMGLTPYIE